MLPSKALRKFHNAADLDGFVPNMSGNLAITMEVYQIKLAVQPGGGLFEVSLTYHIKEDTFKIRVCFLQKHSALKDVYKRQERKQLQMGYLGRTVKI